jgi:2-amino-4-hydroxy-6-hydroxymethyldihydropteridine diphosphokinase
MPIGIFHQPFFFVANHNNNNSITIKSLLASTLPLLYTSMKGSSELCHLFSSCCLSLFNTTSIANRTIFILAAMMIIRIPHSQSFVATRLNPATRSIHPYACYNSLSISTRILLMNSQSHTQSLYRIDSRLYMSQSTPSSPNSTLNSASTTRYRAIIGLGSNLGDRYLNIETALDLVQQPMQSTKNNQQHELVQRSYLYKTAPMYLTDQPWFLNAAVQIETTHDPVSLLQTLKQIEARLGRDFATVRNGPRPVDMDILLMERLDSSNSNNNNTWQPMFVNDNDNGARLTIPHVGISERDFVLRPLIDILGHEAVHPKLLVSYGELEQRRSAVHGKSTAVRVIPLRRQGFLSFDRTLIMGILNVTPDSFSDGGQWSTSIDAAVARALQMEQEGADIIDIGGESTRPGAQETSVNEELSRTIPVIKAVREGEFLACLYTCIVCVVQPFTAVIIRVVYAYAFASVLSTFSLLPLLLLLSCDTFPCSIPFFQYNIHCPALSCSVVMHTHISRLLSRPQHLTFPSPSILEDHTSQDSLSKLVLTLSTMFQAVPTMNKCTVWLPNLACQ